MHLNGENNKMQLDGEKLAASMQVDRRFMFMKFFLTFCRHWVVCPCPFAINI